MKYSNEQMVDAVYTPNQLSGEFGNPFLEAMPEMLAKDVLFERLSSYPQQPFNNRPVPITDRRRSLNALSSAFIPLDYMNVIYNTLFCAIESTYNTSTTIDSIRRIHAIHQGHDALLLDTPAAISSDSGSILGVPGIGKSSTIRRCLCQIPQVIQHTEYRGQKLYCKQITYLVVECPSDCSVKTLALNIIEAIDRAIGSSYCELSGKMTHLPSTSALATRVKILCLTHHIGLIVIDEIQNAILTASRTNQDRPLIKFLVELSNEACTSIPMRCVFSLRQGCAVGKRHTNRPDEQSYIWPLSLPIPPITNRPHRRLAFEALAGAIFFAFHQKRREISVTLLIKVTDSDSCF